MAVANRPQRAGLGRRRRAFNPERKLLIILGLVGGLFMDYIYNDQPLQLSEISFLYPDDMGSKSTSGGVPESSSSDTTSFSTRISNLNNSVQVVPEYILGWSTGHTGSTTAHVYFMKNFRDCPWGQPKGRFEMVLLEEVLHRPLSGDEASPSMNGTDPCYYTRTTVIPYLDKLRQRHTWVDLGHYHNRGPVLECLAEALGARLALIYLRRNRHHVARSFASRKNSSCLELQSLENIPKTKKPKGVVYCPRYENNNHWPVALKVDSDQVWEALSPFQKFLWLTDELEYRWYKIQQQQDRLKVQLFELSWTLPSELAQGLHRVRTEMGCLPSSSPPLLPHEKQHIGNTTLLRNCTDEILQDLEYRKIMHFSTDVTGILYHSHVQRVGGDTCFETNKELKKLIEKYIDHKDLDDWSPSILTRELI